MKKILFIIAFLISLGAYSQAYSKYQRLGKLTTAQRNTIDVSDTSVIYTCYNTTTNQEEINTGSGWVARISGAGGPYYFSGLLGNARDNTDLDSELDLLIPNAGPTTITGSKTFSSVQKFIAGLEANGSFEFSASGLPTYPNLNAFYLKPSSDYSGVKIQTGAGSTTVEDKVKFFNVHGNTYTGNPNNLIAEFYGRVKVGEPTASTDAATKGYVDTKDSNVVHRTGIETIAGSKTHTAELKLDSRLYIKPIIGATKATDYATLDVNTDYNIRYVGNGLNNRYILNSNNLTNERIYTLPNKSGTVALMDDLSSSGTSEVAERSLNAGKYHFTSTASNETLTSALVEPATPNLGKKMWRTYTANDTITVPGNLPVGWSSVIEAGSAVDSILIKADTGVDIYGQGNSFVQSGTGIDGLWLKKGRTVALIYKGANSVRAEGPWNVATPSFPLDDPDFVASFYAEDLGADESAVSIWSDRVNSNNATQGTGANQPKVNVEADGKKAVDFDGTNDGLSITEVSGLDFAPGSPMSTVVVTGKKGFVVDQMILFKGNTSSGVTGVEYGFNTSGNDQIKGNIYGATSSGVNKSSTGSVDVWIATSDGSTNELFLNGVSQGTWSVGSANISSDIWIGNRLGGGKYFSGSIRAIGIANVKLSAGQISNISGYDW